MSEFKGTKGKWELTHTLAKKEDNITPLYYTINVNGLSFLSTIKNEYLGISDEEQFANAKLICCAPEMLKMLIMLKDNHDLDLDHDDVEKLIKKATEL